MDWARGEVRGCAAHRAVLRGAGLFWRMTQGSPAWRANPGLNDGIPLEFLRNIEACLATQRTNGLEAFGRNQSGAGIAGTPTCGQRSSAAPNASCTASSARSKSPSTRMSVARIGRIPHGKGHPDVLGLVRARTPTSAEGADRLDRTQCAIFQLQQSNPTKNLHRWGGGAISERKQARLP